MNKRHIYFSSEELSSTLEILNEGAVFIQLYQGKHRAKIDEQWVVWLDRLIQMIQAADVFNDLEGLDFVPAYTSLLIQFEPTSHLPEILDACQQILVSHPPNKNTICDKEESVIELPIYYGGEHAQDLECIAKVKGLSIEQVIQLHSEAIYTVFALGFSPGFAFMGQVNPKLRLPRRESPRKKVLAGTVAIAENQTAIYPKDSPGGWHGIGYCPSLLFDVSHRPPSILKSGQKVRFKPISKPPIQIEVSDETKNKRKNKTNECLLDQTKVSDQAPAFKVIKSAGIHQYMDLGRTGASQSGLTPSGPMDRYAYEWANRLLDNHKNDLAIEITMGGLSLECLQSMDIAITGADLNACIESHGQRKTILPWLSYRIESGDRLIFQGFQNKGLRSYLAIRGGFDLNYSRLFGSYSTVMREGLGGEHNQGGLLSVGDILKSVSKPHSSTATQTWLKGVPYQYRTVTENKNTLSLTISLCYQAEDLGSDLIHQFLSQTYIVSQNIDRMAYRLNPESADSLSHNQSINSEGIALGSVQITPDGEPIIMMRDRQTLGGYPKIGVITLESIDHLAQASPGQKIHFNTMESFGV